MTKLAIWCTVGILLPYFVFTSGLFYWASGCDVTDKLVTPFSWALSAKEKGFTPIATEGDIDCIIWLLEETDQDVMIVGDSNGVFLFESHHEFVGPGWLIYGMKDRLEEINDIFSLDRCYLFLTDWNVRKGKYTLCSDVGLRRHFAFDIAEAGDGCLAYAALVPEGYKKIVVKTALIKEVYRSGGSRVYEKVE